MALYLARLSWARHLPRTQLATRSQYSPPALRGGFLNVSHADTVRGMPKPSPRVVETVNKDGVRPRQVRISAKVRHALRCMAFEGMERKKAAEKAGLKDDSLYVALRRPEVKALLNEYVADLRKSAAARSIARVDRLADSAESEHVRFQANTFLLGIEGVRPSERVEHDHTHRIVPGYVLDPSGPDLGKPDHMRDVTPQIANLGTDEPQGAESGESVRHDEESNDHQAQDVGGMGGQDDSA